MEAKRRALPVALAILVGASTLDGEFVGDDGRALLDNPVVNGALPANAVLTHDWGESLDGPNAVSFRPATSLLWRAVWSLAHEQPFPFRALGLVLHAVAVFFAWRWLGALGTPLRARVIAASLLAAHAVGPETTGAIVSHADLGAAALGFAALDVLARRRGIAASCLGGLLLLFAGFMKESAVLFGILGAVTAYTSGLRGRQLTLRGLVLGLPVLLVIAAQLSYTRSADLARAEWSLGNVAHGFDRVLLGLHFLARALGLTVLPVGIAPSHGYAAMELDPGALAPLAAAGALLLAAGVVAGIVALRAHDTVMATALMLLFGPVLLVTHLVIPIITDLPERVLYPATLGAGLLLGLALERAYPRLGSARTLGIAALFLTVQLGLGHAPRRVDRPLRWIRAYEVEPRVVRHELNIAWVLMEHGRFEEAWWHELVGQRLKRTFPNPVDWDEYDAIAALGPERAFREGARRLEPDPRRMCALVIASLEHVQRQNAAMTQHVLRELRPSLPECEATDR